MRTGDSLRKLLSAEYAEISPSGLASSLADLKSGAPQIPEWRISDHVAAVSRLYALYENFVDELLSSWINLRASGQAFGQLPDEWRKQYQAGFSLILPLAGQGRYEHLSHDGMVVEQAKAIAGETGYRTFPECMLHRTANLRMDVLTTLAARCQITALEDWFAKSTTISTYLGAKTEAVNRLTKKLKRFVEYRNDASHSSVIVDEILGLEEIIDLADLIEALCSAIRDKVNHVAVEYLVERGEAREIGFVTKTYSNNVYIITIEGAALTVGERILIKSPRACSFRTIVNLQLEGVDSPAITVAMPAEIGIQLDAEAHLSDKLIVLVPHQDTPQSVDEQASVAVSGADPI